LIVGVFFWVLVGVVCYAREGIKVVPHPSSETKVEPSAPQTKEWHSASDFVLPGNRKRLLPPKY
jgi:hypothetical protein